MSDVIVDLIRHAESEWVKKAEKLPVPHFGGRMNPVKLSSAGRKEAALLGKYARKHGIQPSGLVSSPATRALDTGAIAVQQMGLSLQPSVLTDLQELSWGDWEQGPRSVQDEEPFKTQRKRQGLKFCPPGGESFEMVGKRATAALEQVASRAGAGHLWVLTHNNVIKSVVQPLLGWDADKVSKARPDVVSITRLRYNRGKFTVEFFARPTK